MTPNHLLSEVFLVAHAHPGSDTPLRILTWRSDEPYPLERPLGAILEHADDSFEIRALEDVNAHTPKRFGSAKYLRNPEWIDFGPHRLKIVPLPHHPLYGRATGLTRELAEAPNLHVPSSGPQEIPEASLRKYLLLGLLTLAFLCGVVGYLGHSRPNAEELIPPQFAKVILSPAFKARPAPAHRGGAKNSAVHTHVNVVQAFHSDAVQKSAHKLIHGGALALLAKSSLLGGLGARNRVNELFSAKGTLAASSSPLSGETSVRSVDVGTIGGKAGQGQGVGYGEGKNASVSGQGAGLVTLDTTDVSVDEGLSADEVGRVIHRHLNEVRYCYEAAILQVPHLEGRIAVDFTVGGTGRVKSSGVKSTTIHNSTLEQCLLSHLNSWKFPSPKGGIDVAVSYPFVFKTLD